MPEVTPRWAPIAMAVVIALALSGCGSAPERGTETNRQPQMPEVAVPAWMSQLLPGFVQDACFSPDGRQLVVELAEAPAWNSVEDDGPPSAARTRLFLVSLTGEHEPITEGPLDVAPAWDPAGGRVAFVTMPSSAALEAAGQVIDDTPAFLSILANEVCIVDVATRRVRVPQMAHGLWWIARWSPDGRMLACAGQVLEGDSLRWVLALAGPSEGSPRIDPLPAAILHVQSLAWSPDGRSIALYTMPGRPGPREIYVLDVAGRTVELVHSAVTGPGCEQIAYVLRTGKPCFLEVSREQDGHAVGLKELGAGSDGHRELARIEIPAGSSLGTVRLSPDGEGLAGGVSLADGKSEFILWSHAGRTGSIPVAVRRYGTDVVAWSHSAHEIAVTYPEEDGSRIAVYRLVLGD